MWDIAGFIYTRKMSDIAGVNSCVALVMRALSYDMRVIWQACRNKVVFNVLYASYRCTRRNRKTYVVSRELHSSDRIGRQGKNNQRLSSNSGPTLCRGASATRAIDPSQDPSSPIALKYRYLGAAEPATTTPHTVPASRRGS